MTTYINDHDSIYEVEGYTQDRDGYLRAERYRRVGSPNWHAMGGFHNPKLHVKPDGSDSIAEAQDAVPFFGGWQKQSSTALPMAQQCVCSDDFQAAVRALRSIAEDEGAADTDRIEAATKLARTLVNAGLA